MPTRSTSRKPKSGAKAKSKARAPRVGRKLTRKQIAAIIGGSITGAGALGAGAYYGYKHWTGPSAHSRKRKMSDMEPGLHAPSAPMPEPSASRPRASW